MSLGGGDTVQPIRVNITEKEYHGLSGLSKLLVLGLFWEVRSGTSLPEIWTRFPGCPGLVPSRAHPSLTSVHGHPESLWLPRSSLDDIVRALLVQSCVSDPSSL